MSGAQPMPAGPWHQPPPRRRPALVAPFVALLGLLLLAGGSLWAISTVGGSGTPSSGALDPSFSIDESPDPGPGGEPSADPLDSPAASSLPSLEPSTGPSPAGPTLDPDIVVTPPPGERPAVKGTILFTRQGNIWAASGLELRKLTRKGSHTAPAWSPDGRTIYFVETRVRRADSVGAGRQEYTFYYPNIMSIRADGTRRKEIYGSLVKRPTGLWFSWVLQPDVSPDGRTLALVSDGVDGEGEVKLFTLPTRGGRLSDLRIRSQNGLGHNDPAWSPDGSRLAFTYNTRDGQIGAPKIGIYTPRGRSLTLLRKGYANPSWSPDGKWLVVEATTGTGRDIVIIGPRGAELAQLTNDGDSFSPEVSPDGDQIAYLHRDGLGIDLRVATLQFEDGHITLVDDRAVTEDGSLDAESPPAWFIPEDQRKPPPTAPSPEPGDLPSPEIQAAPVTEESAEPVADESDAP